MLLIFDTAQSKALVILALDQKNIKKTIWDADFRHSEELLPKISELLVKNKLSIKSLKGVSVISGPGSYTGLRVGVACANALGYVLSIPVVDINKLELLAHLGLEYLTRTRKFQQGKTHFCSLVYAAVSEQLFGATYQLRIKNQRLILEQVEDFFAGNLEQLSDLIKKQTFFSAGKDKEGDLISFTFKKKLNSKFLGIKYFDLFSDKAIEVLTELSFKKLKEKKPGEIVTPLYIRKPNITRAKTKE